MSVELVVRQHAQELIQVLPSHLSEKGEGWMTGALAAVKKDKNLWSAANNNPGSLMNALSESARLGLTPGTSEYYLTVRSNQVLGVVGYQGQVELMYRAGAVSSVIVEPVFSNDRFEYTPGKQDRPIHEIDWFADDRGKLVLAYAYAVMKDGAVSKVVVVNRKRIERAKKASSTAGKSFSPWLSDEEAMWMKTAAHDLAKWVPTSAEYIREQVRAVRQGMADPVDVPAGVNPVTGEMADEVVEVELVEDFEAVLNAS